MSTELKKHDGTVGAYMERASADLLKALPKGMDLDRFKRVVMTEYKRNDRLQKCAPITVMTSVMLAAQLGLEVGTLGQCYLIPRRQHGQMQCNFQIGYKGLLALAHRSGDILDVSANVVHENDDFSYSLGDTECIYHRPAGFDKVRGEPIAYYAIVRTKDGGMYRSVMGKLQIEEHAAKFSESYGKDFSPWSKHFDAMAKKTVLLDALKLAPLSLAFSNQIGNDGTTKMSMAKDLIEPQVEEIREVDIEVKQQEGESYPQDSEAPCETPEDDTEF